MLIPKKLNFYDEKSFRCCHCFGFFKIKNEIGQLNCRYHTHKWSNKHKKWKCCNNKNEYDSGCIKCDHMETHQIWYVFSNYEIFYLFKKLKTLKTLNEESKVDLKSAGNAKFLAIRRNTLISKETIQKKFDTFIQHEIDSRKKI